VLGYGSQNTFDNFGSINYILAIMLANLVLTVIISCRCFDKLKHVAKMRSKFALSSQSSVWIRFLLQMNFDVLLMCLLSVLPGD